VGGEFPFDFSILLCRIGRSVVVSNIIFLSSIVMTLIVNIDGDCFYQGLVSRLHLLVVLSLSHLMFSLSSCKSSRVP
jgi:hypothetical protein